ncbi:MAG: hypothetical protein HY518_02260, partial [Candidatus Aenigmarchaeota archaeon]|nr:hypothetical protein [Candidatus Aenigmarchaeota archaeon]
GLTLKPRTIEGEASSLLLPQSITVLRGTGYTFTAIGKNIYLNSTLRNVSLHASGSLAKFIGISPQSYPIIEFNRTVQFNLTLSIPTYLDTGDVQLPLTLNGVIETPRGPSTIYNNLSETAAVSVLVHTITSSDAETIYAEAQAILASMTREGLPTKAADKMLREMRNAIILGDLEKVSDIGRLLREMSAIARETATFLSQVDSSIRQSGDDGIDTPETSRLYRLAGLAFERGDFATAQSRIKDAQLVYLLETGGKFNIPVLLIKNWILVTILAVAGSGLGYMGFNAFRKAVITKTIRRLSREEASMKELIRNAQKACFEDKKITVAEYYKQMSRYEKKLEQTRQRTIELKSMRISLIHAFNELVDLKNEYSQLAVMIKELQDDYFRKGRTDWRSYTQKMEILKERRAEVEKHLAFLEAKAAIEKYR